MVLVLYGLAALFAAGGVLAFLLGFDLGGTERGMALQISSTIALGSGAILVGLAAILQRLDKLGRGFQAPFVTGLAEEKPVSAPALPVAFGVGAAAAVATALAVEAAQDDKHSEPEPQVAEPPKPAPQEPETTLTASEEPEKREPEAKQAEPAPAPAMSMPAIDALTLRIEQEIASLSGLHTPPATPELGVKTESKPVPAEPPAVLPPLVAELAALDLAEDKHPVAPHAPGIEKPGEPSASPEAGPAAEEPAEEGPEVTEPAPVPHPAVAEAAAPVAPADPGQQVIGNYTVGGNNYIMFADGSVEAVTDAGIYRFASLDELKTFIAAGGKMPA